MHEPHRDGEGEASNAPEMERFAGPRTRAELRADATTARNEQAR